MFPPVQYLEWMWERTAEVDLGSGGLGGREEGLVPERLEGVSDPPEGTDLASQIADRYDASVTPAHVLVTAGTTHANVIAFATALGQVSASNPTMVVEAPAYEPLVSTPTGLGARIRLGHRDTEDEYALDPTTVGEALDASTAMAVVSNRHNPSGQLAARGDLEALAEEARSHGVPVLVDEVYAPYCPSAETGAGTAFGGPTAAGLEGTVVTNSLTKFFGFGGLRIGWLIAEPAFVERARSVSAHLPDVSAPGRALAKRAFHDMDAIVERSRERVAENADRLSRFRDERDDLVGTVPEGTTFGFLGHRTADGDQVTEAAEAEGILVVPGRFFGDPSRFRISLSGPPSDVRTGLGRFGDVLDTIDGGEA